MKLILRRLIFGFGISSGLWLACFQVQALEIPELKHGQFVYTVPPNFDPPLIDLSGLRELNQEALKLHEPYYIVLIDKLDANDSTGEAAIESLAASWKTQYPERFNAKRSQIFVLAYQPRKYRFLAGTQFIDQYGFERSAHLPYTQIFENAVKTEPKDPKTGIIEMMQAVDKYLKSADQPSSEFSLDSEQAYERSVLEYDRDRLRDELASQETVQKNYAQQIKGLLLATEAILDRKRGTPAISSQIELNQTVFRQLMSFSQLQYTQESLRMDLQSARTLEQEQEITGKIAQAALIISQTSLRPFAVQAQLAQEFVDAYESDQQSNVNHQVLIWLGVSLFLILFLLRFGYYQRYKWQLKRLLKKWQQTSLQFEQDFQALTTPKYQKSVSELKSKSGETQRELQTISEELKNAGLSIKDFKESIVGWQKMAQKGHLFDVTPLKLAIYALASSGDTVNLGLTQRQLDSMPGSVQDNPYFRSEALKQTLHALQTKFKRLTEAAEARQKPPEALFPMSLKPDPNTYHPALILLAKHPLANMAQPAEQLYADLGAIRWSDPAKYLAQIDILIHQHRLIEKDLIEAQQAIELLNSLEQTIKIPERESRFSVSDDPTLIFESLKQRRLLFIANLDRSNSTGLNLKSFLQEAKTLIQEFHDLQKHLATIEAVLQNNGSDQTLFEPLCIAVSDWFEESKAIIKSHEKSYRNFDPETYLAKASPAYQQALDEYQQGIKLEKEGYRFSAYQSFKQALERLRFCKLELNRFDLHCQSLVEQKRNYEERLKSVRVLKRTHDSYMRTFDSSKIEHLPQLESGQAQNYVLLLAALNTLELNFNDNIDAFRASQYDNSDHHSFGSGSFGDSGGSSSGGNW